MIKVLLVNHSLGTTCGLFAHGKRLERILSSSKKYTFYYGECSSMEDLSKVVKTVQPRVIIYNYLQSCFPWVGDVKIKYPNISHVGITHDIPPGATTSDHLHPFDYRITVDPSIPCSGRWFKSTSRALFNFKHSNPVGGVVPTIPKIGTFGFFLPHKFFGSIINSVKEEFEEAIINMHLTVPFFDGDSLQSQLSQFTQAANDYLKGSKIALNITTNRLSDNDLITLLNSNDLNVFFYSMNIGSGPSSGIDYSVAAGKPIITNVSYQFRHVAGRIPIYPETSLRKAIELGNSEILKLQEEWSDEKVLQDYESMIEQIG